MEKTIVRPSYETSGSRIVRPGSSGTITRERPVLGSHALSDPCVLYLPPFTSPHWKMVAVLWWSPGYCGRQTYSTSPLMCGITSRRAFSAAARRRSARSAFRAAKSSGSGSPSHKMSSTVMWHHPPKVRSSTRKNTVRPTASGRFHEPGLSAWAFAPATEAIGLSVARSTSWKDAPLPPPTRNVTRGESSLNDGDSITPVCESSGLPSGRSSVERNHFPSFTYGRSP